MLRHLKYIIAIICIIVLSACHKGEVKVLTHPVDVHTSYDLNSVAFVNDSVGYICGGSRYVIGIVSRTSDGGRTWSTPDSAISKALYSMSLFSGQEMFAGGFDGFLAYTNDSAKTFSSGQFNNLPIWHLAFRDRQHGVAACGLGYTSGAVYHTADGGASWALSFRDTMHSHNGAAYPDDTTVVICGYGTVLRSTDGGTSFTVVKQNGDFYQDIKFVNATTGYAVGYQGEIIRSIDAGRTWQIVKAATGFFTNPEHLLSLDFTDENNGYAIGESGLMVRTSNGGQDWQTVRSFTSERLRGIHLFSPTAGIVVGSGGKAWLFQQ